MHDIEPVSEPTPADLPENHRDAFADALLSHWPRLAATAWEGYRTQGRGTVVVLDEPRGLQVRYAAGAPCECHAELVREYDPAVQVVIAVVAGSGGGREVRSIGVFGGWPRPAEAWNAATVGVLGGAVH